MDLSNLSNEELLAYDEQTFDNWFSAVAIEYFQHYLLPFKNEPFIHFVQLGAYRGHASKWLMENVLTNPTSTLTDIDCWMDWSAPNSGIKGDSAELMERTYLARIEPYKDRIRVIKNFTMGACYELGDNSYDFIYVDADHTASSVILDATHYWPKLKQNGIMAFDDYNWFDGVLHPLLTPKLGIDVFIEQFQHELQVLTIGEQVWVRKI